MLRKFDLLYADVESENHLTVEDIILGLGGYFSCSFKLKQKRAMRRGMRKTNGLKVIRYTDYLIDLNA